MTLHELQRRLKSLSVAAATIAAIQDTAPDIVRLNQDQLLKGINAEGKYLRNRFTRRYDYSVFWGEYRLELGLQVDHFDLRVTGAFFAGMDVFDISADSYTIDSRDIKTEDLEDMFGKIFGLTEENRTIYVQSFFFPAFKAELEKKLGKIFPS